MKKSLLAVAAMGAFASAAQAQSSVTVYGILDVGYVGYNTREANLGRSGVSGNQSGTVVKSNGNAFSSSAESTSRLGFKGVEDLGGGTSAFFTIELGVTPNSAQAVSTSGTQNRQSFVGLKKNGIGEAAVGTQYTLIHKAVAATDPGQANNIAGNLIYPATTEGTGSESNSTGAAYTVRTNNQLSINSANFSGFSLNAMWVMNDKNSNQTTATNGSGQTNITGGTNNQNGWGVGANFAWQKLLVTANWQNLNSKNPYNNQVAYQLASTNGLTTTIALQARPGFPTVGYAGGASTPGTNVKDNQFYAAATYDFGILKAYAQYINRKATNQYDSSFYIKRQATQIGVRSFITPTIEAWASGGLGKYTGFGGNAANMTAWQVGSNYYLSKRTNLYAIYGQAGTSNASLPTNYSGGTSNANPSSANVSNYAVGVRHTF